MKRVIKVINKEIDRLFGQIRLLATSINGIITRVDKAEAVIDELQEYTTALDNQNDDREAETGELKRNVSRYIAAHGNAIEELQKRLESMEKYLVSHVDPQLAYGDTLDGMVDLDDDIEGEELHVTIGEEEGDVQVFHLDPMPDIRMPNQFYTGPANREYDIRESYRYRLAQHLSGGCKAMREELLLMFQPLSEDELIKLMKVCAIADTFLTE